MTDPFSEFPPELRLPAWCAVEQCRLDTDQMIYALLDDGLAPDAIFETVRQVIAVYATVIVEQLLAEAR